MRARPETISSKSKQKWQVRASEPCPDPHHSQAVWDPVGSRMSISGTLCTDRCDFSQWCSPTLLNSQETPRPLVSSLPSTPCSPGAALSLTLVTDSPGFLAHSRLCNPSSPAHSCQLPPGPRKGAQNDLCALCSPCFCPGHPPAHLSLAAIWPMLRPPSRQKAASCRPPGRTDPLSQASLCCERHSLPWTGPRAPCDSVQMLPAGALDPAGRTMFTPMAISPHTVQPGKLQACTSIHVQTHLSKRQPVQEYPSLGASPGPRGPDG